MKELSFETLDLLATLGNGRKNAKPIVLLARQMDVSKRKVMQFIEQARKELEDSDTLIMTTGHGSYYKLKREAAEDVTTPQIPLLQLFQS